MTAVNPSWIDGLPVDAFRARRIDSLMVMPNGLDPLGARSGILPGSNGFNVTVSGTTITVGTGIGSLYFAGQGIYRIAMTSTSNLTLDAPHATLPRIDLVYLRVWDNSVDGSGQNKADVVYLAGTPSSTPSAPTPAGTVIYMRLAHITVPASGGGSPTVNTTVRPITVASGGILPSSTAPSTPYVGQYYDDGANLLRWNGTSYDTYQKAQGAWTSWTPTWSTTTGSNIPVYGNATVDCRYTKMSRTVLFYMNITFGNTTNFRAGATDNWSFSLPPSLTAAQPGAPCGKASLEPGSTQRATSALAQINTDASTLSLYIDSARVDGTATAAGIVDAVSPFVWGSAMRLSVVGQYEATS
ncbi:hypothetical protein [Streptomyces sp. NPDC003857]